MFVVIYRWKIKSGTEQTFRQAWITRTKEIRAAHGALGSRLHSNDDGFWVAYAQWPSREHWETAGQARIATEASEVIKECTESTETLFRMAVTDDLLLQGSRIGGNSGRHSTLERNKEEEPDFAKYDRSIRELVPFYDEMMTNGIAVLKASVHAAAHILDLGSGTGRAAEAILRCLPAASVELSDVNEPALALARRRLQAFDDRATFRHGSYLEALPHADAVVASLSLHHVLDLPTKVATYRRIYDCLHPSGMFLCFDAVVSHDPDLARLTIADWTNSMVANGIDEATAHAHFKTWSATERYMPLADELGALTEAGFDNPECFWRRGPMAIYGARKGSKHA